jgi:hypothetical protein
MVFGIVLIFFVQWLFLGNLRSALIVAATIPFALFFAITMLLLRGESANLLSVGAIDFGLIVDSTVIMVENIFRHLAEPPTALRLRTLGSARRATHLSGKLAEIYASASEVNQAILFSAGSSSRLCSIFTMSGVEGHFRADGKTMLRHRRRSDRHLYDNPGLEAICCRAVSRPRPLFAASDGFIGRTQFVLGNRIVAGGLQCCCSVWQLLRYPRSVSNFT